MQVTVNGKNIELHNYVIISEITTSKSDFTVDEIVTIDAFLTKIIPPWMHDITKVSHSICQLSSFFALQLV